MTKRPALESHILPTVLKALESKSFDAVGVTYDVSGATVKRFLKRHGVDLAPYLRTRGGDRRPPMRPPTVLQDLEDEAYEPRRTAYQGKEGAPRDWPRHVDFTPDNILARD